MISPAFFINYLKGILFPHSKHVTNRDSNYTILTIPWLCN